MRLRPLIVPILLAFSAACNPATVTQPVSSESGAAGSSADHDEAASACTVELHAILRESDLTAVVGQVQFRIHPPDPGASHATVDYRGVYGPTSGLTYGVVEVALVSRVSGQDPTWSDSDKTDPGATLTSVAHFGRVAPMSPDMALALIDDASRFKAVVNVLAASGGREAEGTVEPTTRVPERLRHKQRTCFGGS